MGIKTDYVYDNAGMLTSETVSSPYEQIQHTQYAYDNRGNRIVGGDEYSENYTCDLNNRLTKVTKVVYNEYEHPDNILNTWYNYDFNGNLFSKYMTAMGLFSIIKASQRMLDTGDVNRNNEVVVLPHSGNTQIIV